MTDLIGLEFDRPENEKRKENRQDAATVRLVIRLEQNSSDYPADFSQRHAFIIKNTGNSFMCNFDNHPPLQCPGDGVCVHVSWQLFLNACKVKVHVQRRKMLSVVGATSSEGFLVLQLCLKVSEVRRRSIDLWKMHYFLVTPSSGVRFVRPPLLKPAVFQIKGIKKSAVKQRNQLTWRHNRVAAIDKTRYFVTCQLRVLTAPFVIRFSTPAKWSWAANDRRMRPLSNLFMWYANAPATLIWRHNLPPHTADVRHSQPVAQKHRRSVPCLSTVFCSV